MKKLLKITPIILSLVLLLVIAILFYQKQKLEAKIASLPEVGEMIPEREYKFFTVFESKNQRYAVVSEMKEGNSYHPPILIKVGKDFPVTGDGFEQVNGFIDSEGNIKTL